MKCSGLNEAGINAVNENTDIIWCCKTCKPEVLEMLVNLNKFKEVATHIEKIQNQMNDTITKFKTEIEELKSEKQKENVDLTPQNHHQPADQQVLHQIQMEVRRSELLSERTEQYERRDSIIISGVREHQQEDLYDITCHIAYDMGVNIDSTEISVTHRLGQPGRKSAPRPIIVKFVRRNVKTAIMRNKKKLRRVDAARYIYIDEDLTPFRASIVKELRREGKLVTTNDGKIFTSIKSEKGEHKIVLDSPNDFFNMWWTENKKKEMGIYPNCYQY